MGAIIEALSALWDVIAFAIEGLGSFISQLVTGVRYVFDLVNDIVPLDLMPYALSALFIMFTLQVLGRSGG